MKKKKFSGKLNLNKHVVSSLSQKVKGGITTAPPLSAANDNGSVCLCGNTAGYTCGQDTCQVNTCHCSEPPYNNCPQTAGPDSCPGICIRE